MVRRPTIQHIPNRRFPTLCKVLLDGKVFIPKTTKPEWAVGGLFMQGMRGELIEQGGKVRTVDIEAEVDRLCTEKLKSRSRGVST